MVFKIQEILYQYRIKCLNLKHVYKVFLNSVWKTGFNVLSDKYSYAFYIYVWCVCVWFFGGLNITFTLSFISLYTNSGKFNS